MPNKKANNRKSIKINLKVKPLQDVTFIEKKTENNISINKFYIYGIIFFFSFLLYGNTIFNDYALDDLYVITGNSYTQKGISGIKEIFSNDFLKGYHGNMANSGYRPLAVASFATEYQFFGLNPHISHFTNVLLYSLTCLLIYILLSNLLWKYRHYKWYVTIPFISTLLFVAHPIHTEVVANIKSRDEILSLFFSLLTLWFLLKYLNSSKIIFLFFSSILFSFALFSKESSIVFIIILPLTFYYFTNHSLKKIISSIIPLFVILITFIILRQIIISKSGTAFTFTKDLMVNPFADMNFLQKYATIIYTLGLYIKLLLYPHPLTWDYFPNHIPIMEWFDFAVLFSLLIYLFLLFFFFKGLKTKSFFSWCIFIFLTPLFLTSNILFVVGAPGERFLYSASLGFTSIIAYFFVMNPGNYFKTLFSKPYIFLIPVLFLYSFKTITRNMEWKNTHTIIETDVKTSSNSAKSNDCYGVDMFNKADSCIDIDEKVKYYELALQYFEKALKINPNSINIKGVDSYGNDLYNKAEKCKNAKEKVIYYELAFRYCEKAYKINPDRQKANFVLGNIYLKYKNDLNKSIFYLNNAVNLGPKEIESYVNLSLAYGSAQKYDKAIEVFEKALKIAPENVKVLSNFAAVYNNIANICENSLEKAKYYELSLHYCEKVFKINPDNQLTNLILGIIYLKYKNDLNKSIFYLNRAVNLDLYDIESYNNLGMVYIIAKKYDKAIEVYENALKITPQDVNILSNLASAYNIIGKTDKAREILNKTVKSEK